MSAPKINLAEYKTNSGTSYFLDYRLNGQRIRMVAGMKKSDAEIMRAKLQTDFNLATVGIQLPNRKTISLEELTKEFLDGNSSA